MAWRSVFGEADHTPFGASGLELIYGREADGSLVHVSAVRSGLACACVCPACERRLVARKGKRTAHHFAHYGAGAGCGRAVETNAHIWAKEVLERTRQILLPAIEAEEEGRHEVARPASMFKFDEVRLERRFGDIVPDVIVRAGTRELLVEVYVTHRCDDAKVDKIRAGGVSAMEVDLSGLRTCQDPKRVAAALLRTAPRAWLYNPFVDAAAQKLRARVAREKADAAAALRRQAARMIADARKARRSPGGHGGDEGGEVRSLGRGAYLLWSPPSHDGFTVDPVNWQAAVFARCIMGFASRPTWFRQSFDAYDILERIQDCVAPAFGKRLGHGLVEALREIDPGFIPPSVTLSRYLAWLAEAGVLINDGYGYQVSHGEAQDLAKLKRRREVIAARRSRAMDRVSAIVAKVPERERTGFDLSLWMRAPVPDLGTCVEELIEADDQAWWTFEAGLDRLESMQAGWSWTESLLGLPLAGELARAKERERAKEEAAAERKRQEKEAAAQNRLAIAVGRAEGLLGVEAAAEWLHRPGRNSGISPADAARTNGDGLEKVLRALQRIETERREQQAREDAQASARDELRRAAAKVFDDARAEVFLKSAHPALGGQSPLAYCADPVSLRACLGLLPARRRA